MDCVKNWVLLKLEEGSSTDRIFNDDLYSSYVSYSKDRGFSSLELRYFIKSLIEVCSKLDLKFKQVKVRRGKNYFQCVKFTKPTSNGLQDSVRVSVIQTNKYQDMVDTMPHIKKSKVLGNPGNINLETEKTFEFAENTPIENIEKDEKISSDNANESERSPFKPVGNFCEVVENFSVFCEQVEENCSIEENNVNFHSENDTVENLEFENIYPDSDSQSQNLLNCSFDNFENSNISASAPNDEFSEPVSANFHPFFGKVKLKSGESSVNFKEQPLTFHFRQPEKENHHFNNNIFAKHYKYVRGITPGNFPCKEDNFTAFLSSEFPRNDNFIWQRCKNFSTEQQKKTMVFLTGSFLPVSLGTKSAKYLAYPVKTKFPQFTAIDSKNTVAKCEACSSHNEFLRSIGQGRSTMYDKLLGYRQIYEHYVCKAHNLSLKWLEDNYVEQEKSVKLDQIPITSYGEFENKLTSHCCYIWDKELVECFKNDSGIRRKQPKTLFSEMKVSLKCSGQEGHLNCVNYKHWKRLHQSDYKNLCEIAQKSSRSIYVEGDEIIYVRGKSIKIEGGIKSLDLPCLKTASTTGDHPYTCRNCYLQKPILQNNMAKKLQNKLSQDENRIGTRRFRSSYANTNERVDYINSSMAKTKELKNDLINYKKTILKSKTWEEKLSESCANENDKKLVVDLLMLLQNRNDSIQMMVLKNIIGKLKSGRNHRYLNIIKDIGELHKNRLGPSNYSLLRSLFGLPSKSTCNNYNCKDKFKIGFHAEKIEKAISIYSNYPVIDCTDEARILRFISPVENGDQIELIGECWDPDIDNWSTCTRYVPSDSDRSDQYALLKNYVDDVISKGNLAEDVAIHNFAAIAGPRRFPFVYMAWPSPNKGYTAYHLLKIWDCVRKACFLDSNKSLRNEPLRLLGHASDSAGFQLSAANALMTPNSTLMAQGIQYLCLGVGESKYAAPYFGPLPSIAYLDYDHEQRLLLKCLKYETLNLTFWPESCIATISHLKELQKILLKNQLDIPFLESDLLLARFMDQNCDAAIRIFTMEVADLLEDNIAGSEGTVLYIRAVTLLMHAFRGHSQNPNKIQFQASAGITIFRLWQKIVKHHTKMKLNAAPGAASDVNKRGNFLTSPCFKTAEILFSATTNHMLAMYSHFKDLGPEAVSLAASGTKTTERIISEIQGKTNQIQSLDAQPTLQDAVQRISKVTFNQQAEEKLILEGATKEISTSRKRLAHKITATEFQDTGYSFPETFLEFRKEQINSYKEGCPEGQRLFAKYCASGEKFLKEKMLWDCSSSCPVLKKNLFRGCLSTNYGIWALTSLSPADVLLPVGVSTNIELSEVSEEESNLFDNVQESLGVQKNDLEEKIERESEDEGFSDGEVNTINEEKPNNKWYISRKNGDEKTKIHVKTALKILIPREYVSRERKNRHIAANFLPGLKPFDDDHDIAQFDYAVIRLAKGIEIGKIVDIFRKGVSVLSENSSSSDCKFRAVLLEKVDDFSFKISNPVKVTKNLPFDRLIQKVDLKQENGLFVVVREGRENFKNAVDNFLTIKDFQIAKALQSSSIPIDYEEVEDIIRSRIDPKTHCYLYEVKFVNRDETMWLSASDFLDDIVYQNRCSRNSPAATKKQFAIPKKEKAVISFQKQSSSCPRKKVSSGSVSHRQKRKTLHCNTITNLLKFERKKPKLDIWLDDQTIHNATTFLKTQSTISGLQDTLLSASFVSVGPGGMQIHHDGSSHWLFSIDGDQNVIVFDSLYSKPTKSLCGQLLKCYPHKIFNGELWVHYPERQRQTGGDDCGLFALAYATEAALERENLKSMICFDQHKMRLDLAECLSRKIMSVFPKSETTDFLETQDIIIFEESETFVEKADIRDYEI